MDVHVVANINDGWVLGYLANVLIDHTGWTHGKAPRPNADVNYFLPYLNRPATPCNTLTAAWFTHRDTANVRKAQRWDDVAGRVNLALTSARQYMGAGWASVRPAIAPQFIPMKRKPNAKPVIGVAGQVYGDGRKGEDLIGRLAASLGDAVTVKASGKGWPVPTSWHKWHEMPGYYRSLDVLVCASRIEGVPMPPLEAMACGVPVVIPRGVGMLDELGDHPKITRFEAGNYESLERAVGTALEGLGHDPSLRTVVRDYNAVNWASDHVSAFEQAFGKPKASHPLAKSTTGKRGVYYVAFGEPSRKCAEVAMTSWREHMPEVPIALASDRPMGIEDHFIPLADADIGGRIAKLSVDDVTPPDWEYILYLDADTEIVAPVNHFFDVLADGWEFVICKDPAQYATTRNMIRPDNREEVEATWRLMGTDHALQWNGGVWAYRRNERTKQFFKRWMKEWNRWGKRDQAALIRAMYQDPLRIYVMGNEWNTVTRYMDASKSAGVLHYPMTARRWRGIVQERLDSPDAFRRIVR